MSLDFDYRNCGKTPEEQQALSTHPADPEKWHPVGDTLVWMSMFCGFSSITQENSDKVWERIDMYQRISGGSVYGYMVDGVRQDLLITAPDVERYIGLRTNASSKTDAQFFTFLKRIRADNRVDPKQLSAFDWLAAHFAADKVIARAASKAA